jgi:peptidoglycan/xylan/chitin deacetylase (PgdA/CDA1 family)
VAEKAVFSKTRELWNGYRWQSLMGHMSHTIALERLGPLLVQRILWRVATREKVVALSFDDGPHPEFTPAIIALLERHNIPATFFLIGRHVRQHPQLAERLAAGPHEIANHTFSHRILPMLSDHVVLQEIRHADQIIRDVTKRQPRLLRPPMGMFSGRVMDLIEGSGYTTVIGDVYPRDPNMPGRERILRRVMRRVQPGSIVILHDGGNTRRVDRSQTVWAVERIIESLVAQHYRFATVSELMKMGDGSNRRKPLFGGNGHAMFE